MDSVQVVAVVALPPSAETIRKLPEAVSWLQVRADLSGDIPAAWCVIIFREVCCIACATGVAEEHLTDHGMNAAADCLQPPPVMTS